MVASGQAAAMRVRRPSKRWKGMNRSDGIARGSSHESDSSKAWPAAAWAVRADMAHALISATRRSQRIVASCRDRSLQTLPRPRGAPAHGSLRKSRQAPMDSPVATATEGRWIQSVTRGGFGRRDGCDTCVDLDGRKRASRCDESLPTQRMLERHEKFRSHHQWQQPPERQFQSVTRGGFGCRDGCYTCVDLDGRQRASCCDSADPANAGKARTDPMESPVAAAARATVPKCDPRRLRPAGTGVTHVLISMVASGRDAAIRLCRLSRGWQV